MQAKKRKEILLETGTNELEILEFTIGDRYFGINVAKVVSIMQRVPVTPMPNSSPHIEGVFKPRDQVLTLVDLPKYIGEGESKNPERDIYIVTSFNKKQVAFHVHGVESTNRISWKNIEKPDETIYGKEDGLATGIARIGEKLVTIIDFEKIMADINPSTSIQMSDVKQFKDRGIINKHILIAEDSNVLGKMIFEALDSSGFKNITVCSNGQEAWDLLNKYKASDRPLNEIINCVITDIEMPQMDGHRLTKMIKEDEELKILPVIVFSSLINDQMRLKGEEVGANAQLSKPDIGNLVKLIDELII